MPSGRRSDTSAISSRQKNAKTISPSQAFAAAFHLGSDDKTINTANAPGVALAAIQGLNHKLEAALKARDKELSQPKTASAALKRALAASDARFTAIEDHLQARLAAH